MKTKASLGFGLFQEEEDKTSWLHFAYDGLESTGVFERSGKDEVCDSAPRFSKDLQQAGHNKEG